jgi:hypothetical protein
LAPPRCFCTLDERGCGEHMMISKLNIGDLYNLYEFIPEK